MSKYTDLRRYDLLTEVMKNNILYRYKIIRSAFYYMLFLLFISGSGIAQQYTDSIYTRKADTLVCRITLINNTNIFYFISHKKNEISGYISLDSVHSYLWNSKDIPKLSPSDKISIPFDSTNKFSLELKLNAQYNCALWEEYIYLSFYYKGHNIFIGPAFIHLASEELIGDPINDYDPDLLGISFGYRYLWKSWNYKTNLYSQLHFCLYKEKIIEYQKGPPFVTESHLTILESALSVGVNHRLNKKFMISMDAGISIPFSDQYMPPFRVGAGLEYRFYK